MKTFCLTRIIAAFLLFCTLGIQAQPTESNDIPFAKKRLVYQIPEMKRCNQK